MRGATYYAAIAAVKLYSSPALGTAVATLSKGDEAGVSTGNIIKTNGDLFIELIRLSDQKKLYALESDVAMNPAYGGNTLPTVTVKGNKTTSGTLATKVQTQIKKRPVLAYTSLGLLLVGIGTLATKLK